MGSEPEVEKLVVTDVDLRQAAARETTPVTPLVPARSVPWWAISAASFLVLCLPLLCVFALAIRLWVRKADAHLRTVWISVLCTLLIVSGLFTSVLAAWFVTVQWHAGSRPMATVKLRALDVPGPMPLFPASAALSAEDIADRSRRLVFIVSPNPGFVPTLDYLAGAPIGAATLLLATTDGLLLATNRHVADMDDGLPAAIRPETDLVACSYERKCANAAVIARHKEIDLALLWVRRQSGGDRFRQPIAPRAAVRTGEAIFVIGHPQRLFFTLSAGLVSRTEDSNIVQFSAPVSPGNSGGPVYDSYGNLVGVVVSMIDREQSPNAENLNFAIRADTILNLSGWTFSGDGRAKWQQFTGTVNYPGSH